MPWYDDWFGSDAYALVYGHRDEAEAARTIDLVARIADPAPGARILDVGCGRGRHSRMLARRGYDVTGLDLSPASIAAARAQAKAEGLGVTFRVGDMRTPVAAAAFDGVVNLFTAFGYFEVEAEHQRAVDAMAAALRPGGWLVQDYLNAPHVRATLVPEDERTEQGVHIRQRRRIADGRVNKTITLARYGAHAAAPVPDPHAADAPAATAATRAQPTWRRSTSRSPCSPRPTSHASTPARASRSWPPTAPTPAPPTPTPAPASSCTP